MRQPDGQRDEDLQWRRPTDPAPANPATRQPPTPPPYTGPPPMTPPPPGWRPQTVLQVPPPRDLPPQDTEALDAEEKQARTLSYGVGMVAGAVLLVVLFVICGRALI